MPSLISFRRRIATITSIRKITKAQQMVAASKLRRAQEAAEAALPYAEKMRAVIADVAEGVRGQAGAPRLLSGTGKDDVHLLIVATADRGLCGAFNTNIVRLARQRIQALRQEGKTVRILCVGRKGRDQLRRQYASMIVDTVDFMGKKHIGFTDAANIARRVLEMFDRGEFDVASIVYSRFKSVMSQVPIAQQLIPTPVEVVAAGGGQGQYEDEPDEGEQPTAALPRT